MRFPIVNQREAELIERFYLIALFGSPNLPPLSKTGMISKIRSLHDAYVSRRASSLKFTRELSEAYAVYFSLINSIKFFGIISYYFPNLVSFGSILDFGAGTGALLPALELAGFKGVYFGFDPQPTQIQVAHKLSTQVSYECHFKLRDIGEYDCIFLGNVLCELNSARRRAQISKLKKLLSSQGLLILIEPGDRASSQNLTSLKPFLAKLGFRRFFPCPSASDCPLRAGKNWCHGVIQIEKGPLLTRLDNLLSLNHHRVPYSMLACDRGSYETQHATILRTKKLNRKRVADICFGNSVSLIEINRDAFPFEKFNPVQASFTES